MEIAPLLRDPGKFHEEAAKTSTCDVILTHTYRTSLTGQAPGDGLYTRCLVQFSQ